MTKEQKREGKDTESKETGTVEDNEPEIEDEEKDEEEDAIAPPPPPLRKRQASRNLPSTGPRRAKTVKTRVTMQETIPVETKGGVQSFQTIMNSLQVHPGLMQPYHN